MLTRGEIFNVACHFHVITRFCERNSAGDFATRFRIQPNHSLRYILPVSSSDCYPQNCGENKESFHTETLGRFRRNTKGLSIDDTAERDEVTSTKPKRLTMLSRVPQPR